MCLSAPVCLSGVCAHACIHAAACAGAGCRVHVGACIYAHALRVRVRVRVRVRMRACMCAHARVCMCGSCMHSHHGLHHESVSSECRTTFRQNMAVCSRIDLRFVPSSQPDQSCRLCVDSPPLALITAVCLQTHMHRIREQYSRECGADRRRLCPSSANLRDLV